MAKKTVAGYREQKGERSYSKMIKMIKSPRTGAYVFKEEVIPSETIKDLFKMNQ